MRTDYAIDAAYSEMPDMSFKRNNWFLRLINTTVWLTRVRYKWGDDITVTTHKIRGTDNNNIKVIEVAPSDLDGDAPAVVYFHGGAFCLTYAGLHLDCAQMYARECRARVYVVDYRLSTAAPFPAAHNDSQSAVEWVFDNAARLKVDRKKIIVAGDSAGGCLAAACAQMTLDRNQHRDEKIELLAQFLIYPVTDCETKTDTAQKFTDTPVWNTENNKVMWDVYLRGFDYLNGNIPPYASPIHREDFSGLPQAFVEPTEFDPLRDEGVEYAKALEAAGVSTTLVEAKGAVHGYEFVDCEVTRKYRKIRVDAMKSMIAKAG